MAETLTAHQRRVKAAAEDVVERRAKMLLALEASDRAPPEPEQPVSEEQ